MACFCIKVVYLSHHFPDIIFIIIDCRKYFCTVSSSHASYCFPQPDSPVKLSCSGSDPGRSSLGGTCADNPYCGLLWDEAGKVIDKLLEMCFYHSRDYFWVGSQTWGKKKPLLIIRLISKTGKCSID